MRGVQGGLRRLSCAETQKSLPCVETQKLLIPASAIPPLAFLRAESPRITALRLGRWRKAFSRTPITLLHLSLDEAEQVRVEAILVGQEYPVRGALVDLELRLRDQRGRGAPGQVDRRRGVLVAVDDQRRHGDPGQFLTKVGRADASVGLDRDRKRRTQHQLLDPVLQAR